MDFRFLAAYEIGTYRKSLVSRRFQALLCVVEIRLRARGDRDVRALTAERLGARVSDALAASGYEHYLVLQTEFHVQIRSLRSRYMLFMRNM
jgi:hypothetical protein